MALDWPTGLKYRAEKDPYKIPNLGLAPVASPMGSGKTRMRKQFTLRITGLQYTIIFNRSQLAIFEQFVRDTGDATQEFNMPVWVERAGAYQTKLCQIRMGANGIGYEPHGNNTTRVSFTLDVRGLY